ncbi:MULTISPECIES: helix-turn-helix domain-containing protein [Sphingopyxis]|uniref:XRE family transcriptional regulator n=2 Tax=Sphingopyxis macrogoltabida TaxID=33050 RepID=A0A0N9V074_SPHMC|nr:XRE family transcriptional regulator [Sphingopyxis macrogoltabida]ALH80918.1 XRE family transcriptional regulator [Sphingopyxis macrogoltabida]ALJ13668.1 XRE family transcriptional regulator [Sphingopyxis macrogoltabida]
MAGGRKTLGAVMAGLRTRNGWTLKEMSQHSGIPMSTLSKVEHDRLSLTYDKLQQVSERLNISMADLFAEEPAAATVLGRRSVGTLETAVRVETPNYEYNYVCTELRNKRMVPVITRIRAKTIEEFGELVRHSGEEFIYVVEGRLIVHTEFYDPIELNPGESIYIDSGMGHAYVCDAKSGETLTIGVMSSADEDLSALVPSASHRPGKAA